MDSKAGELVLDGDDKAGLDGLDLEEGSAQFGGNTHPSGVFEHALGVVSPSRCPSSNSAHSHLSVQPPPALRGPAAN